MDRFERMVDRGSEALESRLLERGESQANAAGASSLVSNLGLPGLLALMSSSDVEGELGDQMMHVAAAEIAQSVGIPAPRIEQALRQILVRRDDSRSLDRDVSEAILVELLKRAAEEAGLAVSPEELSQAAELLLTGEFYEDAAASTAAVARAIPGLPLAVASDAISVPWRVPMLLGAIVRDLVGLPLAAPFVLADLRDGRIDDPPVVLGRTLRQLFAFSSLGSIQSTLREVTSRRSVQLAIAVWARGNGVPLQPSDLELASEALFDADDPDLGSLLPVAWDRLVEHLGIGEAMKVLSRLGRSA